ncbi:MAG: ATP-binding cassette domain-containing protein, partial [Leptospiraceae bacterium]|nr:ATP-binding cassette domain-containing protein [Leptospiraceae bacterium]
FYAWFNKLPADAAAILTSHDSNLQKHLAFNRILEIRGGKLYEKVDLPQNAKAPLGSKRNPNPTLLPLDQRELWIRCQEADFCNEFEPVLFGINLELKSGDRILLTGHNGAGKTTLLRALHGEIRPVFGKGEIQFVGVLRHEQRRELWQKIAFVSAAQFDFFPAHMRVAEVLATRLSGSLYDYPESLPQQVEPVLREFSVLELLQRNFRELSEGEKTRVLLARAFLMPAVVYLIDEGFMALSERFFLLALNHLNALPASAAVVIAANERIDIIEQGLLFPLQRWYMAHGRLTTAP